MSQRNRRKLSLHASVRAFVSVDGNLIAFENVPYLTDVRADKIADEEGPVRLGEDILIYWINKISDGDLNRYEPVDVRGNEPAVDFE